MKKTNKRGFTLVEVMIVVAIIGLLAAIAIPNLLRARINANDGAVKGDLRAFSTAAESFRAAASNTQYAATVAALTTSSATSPAYLDTSWSLSPFKKHGHTLAYNTNGTGSEYALAAIVVTNESSTHFCIDHTGVLRSNTATWGTAATTCGSTGSVIS